MENSQQPISVESDAWIASRWRAGNWFDVLPDDEIPSDVTGHTRTIIRMFQISLAPEIRKRIEAGAIKGDFKLVAAQLIQLHEGGQKVRLNNEVRGKATIKTESAIQAGDRVQNSDFQNLERFELLDEEIDCGHFTLLWTGRSFTAVFDFQSGKGKAVGLLNLAKQFHWAAAASLDQGYIGPAIDSLFSACELTSKARLTLHRSRAVDWKSHSAVQSAINKWGRMGNVEEQFVRLFNKLSNARPSARYNPEASSYVPSAEDISLVEAEIEALLSRLAPKIPE